MKVPKICAWLILWTALLVGSGCEKAEIAPAPVQWVKIEGCGATPDPVPVKDGDSVSWRVADSGASYIIHFPASNPPTNTPFLVKSSLADVPHPMHKGPGCTLANPTACDYKYNLTRDTSTVPCVDPKVHVIPGP